jgi:hypothetical protein
MLLTQRSELFSPSRHAGELKALKSGGFAAAVEPRAHTRSLGAAGAPILLAVRFPPGALLLNSFGQIHRPGRSPGDLGEFNIDRVHI